MSKEIEVYNAYFGDCIILKDTSDNTNLLVDFGIHTGSVTPKNYYKGYSTRTRSIANDLVKRYPKKSLSLLITHFHEDHINGLVYMLNNQSSNPNYIGLFKKIYIANIWHNPFAVATNLLEEIILVRKLGSQKLSKQKSSPTLLDLLDYLQNYSRDITLISKGVKFENNKYIALWPIFEDDKNSRAKLKEEFDFPDDLAEDILELSEMICVFVVRIVNDNEIYEVKYIKDDRRHFELDEIKAKYNSIAERLTDYFNNNKSQDLCEKNLNEFCHKYNIVFQNTENCSENVLFTGDAEKSHMNKIAKAKDIPLYPQYKFIKIPHHGTDNHYFDFSSYSPKNVIITNGKVNMPASYMISKRYSTLNSYFICANSNFCYNCNPCCTQSKAFCQNQHKIIYRKLFRAFK